MENVIARAGQVAGFVSMATRAINSYFNTTISETTTVTSALAVAALGAYWLSEGSPAIEYANCSFISNATLAKWSQRTLAVMQSEENLLEKYNQQAALGYQAEGLDSDGMYDVFEKDRLAYVDFCRKRGGFRSIANEFKAAGNAWVDCEEGNVELAKQEKCFEKFDQLRNVWNKAYSARLYDEDNYLESAWAWVSGKVLQESARDVLKSVPQRILDANVDATDPDGAIQALSFLKPFEKNLYCKNDKCAFIKKRHRELMLHVHPDRKPFLDAKDADALANRVSQTVNDAKETLCSNDVKESLCG